MEPQSPSAASAALAADGFVDVTGADYDAEPSPNPNAVAEDSTSVELSELDVVQQLISAHESEMRENHEQRRELPEELARDMLVLTCESSAEGGSCVVHVVGTAHVSQESCREVQEVISCLKPEVVFIELCSGRVAILTHQNMKVPTLREMVDSLKKKQNPFGIIYGWFLAKVANQLEVFPGAEFRVAFEEAMKYGGKVVLGDRPIQITLRRTWAKMPVWHKMKLLTSLFFQSLFLPSASDLNKMLKEMNDSDMLTLVVQEMSKQFPTLMETLVHERDQYMSSTLLRVAKESGSVVAVVGKGHLRGIKEHWQQPIDLAKLMEMPSHKPRITVKRIIGTLGAGVAAGAIVGGLFLSRKK
uniref:TraB domain-containing protein n=1 Tax=Kalanchoe fedtschenkoi TaxID=63787 RepID=A0A7N0SXA5_KALFE